MECEKCNSKDLKSEVIKTNYRYSDYFDEYIKEDIVKLKCKNCGYEWEECV